MEKRLLLAFSLTLVFLLVWGRFIAPPPAKIPEATSQPASSETFIADSPVKEAAQPKFADQTRTKDLPEVEIGNFIITYSSTGGYINKLCIGDPDNLLPFHNIGFIAEDQEKKFTVVLGSDRIIFNGPQGSRKEFIFSGYDLEIKISSTPEQMLLFSNYWHPNMLDQRYQEIFYSHGQGIKRSNPKKVKSGQYNNLLFAGGRDRYYCFSLFNDSYDVNWVGDKNQEQLYLVAPAATTKVYIGPQTRKLLAERDLEGIIYFGFFHGIGALMIKLLHFFYAIAKNWGLSIIFFAIFIYFCLFPFTMKSTKAMRRMQEIQPELEALKAKYKDNPQKFSKEQLELFKKYRINPLGGCLPLFLQLPIFIALYQVLFRFVELKGASFLWIKDLSLPDRAIPLPFKIPLLGEYINILPILIMIVGLIQQKVTTAKTTSSEQKSMGLFFSVFLGVIFYNFPAALVLYWFVQNLLTLVYQLRISKTHSLQAA
ncbi:MAG: membrane protein insertase YidC [Candidatus Omnitrophica bacterium]|nr:membrane protein insertase YidC [Candidatus Omnitrophota bacterium]